MLIKMTPPRLTIAAYLPNIFLPASPHLRSPLLPGLWRFWHLCHDTIPCNVHPPHNADHQRAPPPWRINKIHPRGDPTPAQPTRCSPPSTHLPISDVGIPHIRWSPNGQQLHCHLTEHDCPRQSPRLCLPHWNQGPLLRPVVHQHPSHGPSLAPSCRTLKTLPCCPHCKHRQCPRCIA